MQSLTSGRDFVPTGSAADVRWQVSLKNAIRTVADLLEFVGLDADVASPRTIEAAADFPVLVTREFASRIRPGDADDPLLRQVLPVSCETIARPHFTADPVGDRDAAAAPGLLHKYDGRALMITTGACGIHCRYCFRREYPYIETSARPSKYAAAIEYLRQDPSIDEVLLSGGDPLTLTDDALADLVAGIESIDHVVRLRLHTRMPIVLPSRVTDTLIDILRRSRLSVWWVVHVNHANELDSPTLAAIGRLIDAGFPVLNQSVLLRHVNDDADALAELSTRLINARVMPYYLHQLDRVAGSAHHEVPVARGLELIDELTRRLPGYAVPKYVRETAGEASKTPLRPRSGSGTPEIVGP